MSDPQNEHPESESLIKTPKQLIVVVLLAFIVPIVVIILLVTYVGNGTTVGAGSEANNQAVEKRIHPVAESVLKDMSGPQVYKTGEQVYQQVCVTCHATGVAGAPKLGDAKGWQTHLSHGYTALLTTVLHGKNAMPARGGASPDDISDYELARALVYMANASGGKLSEPPPPKVETADATKNVESKAVTTDKK